jgi:5-methylcytosine-specific restriction endonuclease McrA
MPYKDPEKARKAWREYYARTPVQQAKGKERKVARVERNKNYIYEYLLDHSCVDCGEPDPIVLEFDHLRDKHASVYQIAAEGLALQRVIEEIAKCEVACANCHKRRTSRRSNDWKYQRMANID